MRQTLGPLPPVWKRLIQAACVHFIGSRKGTPQGRFGQISPAPRGDGKGPDQWAQDPRRNGGLAHRTSTASDSIFLGVVCFVWKLSNRSEIRHRLRNHFLKQISAEFTHIQLSAQRVII